MALLSGIHDCPEMRFLFAPQKGAGCMRKKLCQATRTNKFGHSQTLCLVSALNRITIYSIDLYWNVLIVKLNLRKS